MPDHAERRPEGLRIVLISAYPPSRGANNEYGYHLVRHLRQKPEIGEIIVLRDEAPGVGKGEVRDETIGAPLRIIPAWRLDALNNAPRLVAAVRRHRPDLVFFNLDFPAFGSGKAAAALGLTTPALVHAAGYPTAALLHSIIEGVDLAKIGTATNPITAAAVRTFGTIVTRLILSIDMVALTMPKYVEILRKKYRSENTFLAPHGTFDPAPPPSFDPPPGPLRLFTFGKFGTYKTVEPLIEAYKLLIADGARSLELVIGGVDSPNAPGYLARVQERYRDTPGLIFTGYLAEEDVPRNFAAAGIVVLPYTSTTGSSSVLHFAGQQGRPVVMPTIGDFADLIIEQGYACESFTPGDAASLAGAIARLLDDPDRRRELGMRNWQAATGLLLSDIADWYLFHFEAILARHKGARARARRQSAATR